MTRLISIKSTSELPEVFKDKVEFQVVDNKVEAVVVKVQGSYIRITPSGTYSNDLKILTEQPKKEVTKYKLKGTLCDVQIEEQIFDDERLAQNKKDDYEYRLPIGEVNLTIEPTVVFVDEDKI